MKLIRVANIHDQHAVLGAVEGRIQGAHQQGRLLVVGADDDAVRLHEVLDRRTFLQELGVGDDGIGHVPQAALDEFFLDGRAHLVGRANRHRALVDDDLVVRHALADRAGGRDDVLQVGRAVLVGRRADTDEEQRAVLHGQVDVRRELQATGSDVAAHDLQQARLVDGDLAVVEDADLLGVHVQADHMVAHLGQTGAGDQADVAGADGGDFHSLSFFKSI
jgi:hypothetical protein